MTQKEIENRMEACPWRERPKGYCDCCTRFHDTIVPCDGCCSWVADYPKLVADYPKLKELEARKENKL